jgi:hypothetical protein
VISPPVSGSPVLRAMDLLLTIWAASAIIVPISPIVHLFPASAPSKHFLSMPIIRSACPLKC